MNLQPPEDIHQLVADLANTGPPFALAMVLKAEGSTPCRAGAKAVFAQGRIAGTIGGGMVEAETERLAQAAIQSRHAIIFDFALHGDSAGQGDPICGGQMRVLVDPTAAAHRDAYAAAAASRKRRGRGVLLTKIHGTTGCETVVEFLSEEAISQDLGFPGAESIRSVLKQERSERFVSETLVEDQRVEVLVEPQIPKPLLAILGGGHVGRAVAVQAGLVGFDIVVIDDRPEFAAPERLPEGVIARCGTVEEEIGRLPLGADTYIVIVTRGHRHDAAALAASLATPAGYIGMIGSRRKVALLRQELLQSARATPQALDRVYAPIGLDIGAATVPEIATSIVAQLIAVRRRGSAPRIPT